MSEKARVIIVDDHKEQKKREFNQSIWTDISERKKAEKKRKIAYQEWESAFNSINDMVSVHDKDFNILRVNKAFADKFKKNSKELIGKKCYETIHGTNETWPNCPLKRTLESGKPITEEFYEPKLGIYLQISTSPVFNENDEITGVVHIAKDVNERKKEEEELKTTRDELKLKVKDRTAELESTVELLKKEISECKKMEEELQFKTALLEAQSQTSIDGLLVVDSEGNVISFNKRMKEMWCIPDELWETGDDRKLLQYAITQLKKPDEFIKKVEYLYTHREEKSRDEIELKDDIYFDRYSSPLEDSNGKYYGRVWYFRDVTDYKKVVNELQETEKELKISAAELVESNAALKVLLKQREEDRKEFEDNILSNMKQLVLPYLIKLKRNKPYSVELNYLNILESKLKEIISPFSKKLSSSYLNFTPKEIQIADLIRDGKRDKDIVEILNISIDTIKSHRKNIRKKLGIYNQKINLRTNLLSLT